MKKLFVPFQLSLKLRELEFDEECLTYYNSNGEIEYSDDWACGATMENKRERHECLAPLWQQAFEFLLPLALKKGRNEFDELVLEYDGYDFKLITKNYIKDILYEEIAKGKIACLEKLIEIVLA